MGACRGATVGVVTEGVDVEATLGVGIVAGKVPRDGGGLRLRGLLEGNSAGDLGITTKNSDYIAIDTLALIRPHWIRHGFWRRR